MGLDSTPAFFPRGFRDRRIFFAFADSPREERRQPGSAFPPLSGTGLVE